MSHLMWVLRIKLQSFERAVLLTSESFLQTPFKVCVCVCVCVCERERERERETETETETETQRERGRAQKPGVIYHCPPIDVRQALSLNTGFLLF
jgi:hypothetical protein